VSTKASRLSAIAIGLVTMLAALAAADGSEQWSQSALQPSATPESPTGLEESDVTERHWEESSQNVTVLASMITHATIEQSQISHPYAMASRVPGFVLANAVNSTGTRAILRGIGTVATNATKNSAAGVISLRSADPINEFESITRIGCEAEASEKQVDAYGIWGHQ
jgi:hypothetical protein